MEQNEIDKLEGRELDAAIAIELGWHNEKLDTGDGKKIDCLVFETPDDPYCWRKTFCPDWLKYGIEGDLPHYSTDIAAAWELDGEGWRWQTAEFFDSLAMWVYVPQAEDAFVTRINFADFPTKAAAYAVAHCRCWLKAQQAEADDGLS